MYGWKCEILQKSLLTYNLDLPNKTSIFVLVSINAVAHIDKVVFSLNKEKWYHIMTCMIGKRLHIDKYDPSW